MTSPGKSPNVSRLSEAEEKTISDYFVRYRHSVIADGETVNLAEDMTKKYAQNPAAVLDEMDKESGRVIARSGEPLENSWPLKMARLSEYEPELGKKTEQNLNEGYQEGLCWSNETYQRNKDAFDISQKALEHLGYMGGNVLAMRP